MIQSAQLGAPHRIPLLNVGVEPPGNYLADRVHLALHHGLTKLVLMRMPRYGTHAKEVIALVSKNC